MSDPNELSVLADFIKVHARNDFDLHVATLMSETAGEHDLWSGNCATRHWDDNLPCSEYEKALSLSIAWLKARVSEGSE